MESRRWVFLIVAIVLVIIAAVFIFTAEVENGEVSEALLPLEISIESEFENKIVYTTNSLADTGPLVEHCIAVGGIFNACGSICESEAEICAAVCAFTCEL